MINRNPLFLTLLSAFVIGVSVGSAPALALTHLSDRTINEAVVYGLENQETDLSTFLGGNWREGQGGALLNIYTPYIEIARSVQHRNISGDNITPEVVAEARQKAIEDVHYIWRHPKVKFMVSLYGETPRFAREYFAVIEGVGKGRNFTIHPTKSIPQYLAEEEKGAVERPFTAINAYHFKYEDIAPLDEFTLKLYGKGMEPITFKIRNNEIQ